MATTIILADDAPFIREILRHILQKCEVTIVGEATNGEEVVELAKVLKPDLIIMDLVMPLKNGIDATREILAQRPTTQIIACTTLDQQAMVVKALEAGCCNYLVKPFKQSSVQSIIEELIKNKQSHVEETTHG